MDKQIRSRRGGPRTFDRGKAIETAMRLFWRHGYEGVSINDLTKAIGIAPPSLYAAFGSKSGLYREALDRYVALPGALDGLAEAGSVDEAVVGLLRAAVRAITDPHGERGCMVSSSMVQCAVEHEDLARDLAERRTSIRAVIEQSLSRWLQHTDAAALARYLNVVLQGLSVQARDGASLGELEGVTNEVIAGFRARHLRLDRAIPP